MNRRHTKLAIVVPWYGDQIPGGAEAESRAVARALQRSGYDVEILTTCVRDFRSDWNVNHHPPGETVESGIAVRRFPVRVRDTAAFDAVNYKLMNGLPLSAAEEETFLAEMVNSPDLCRFIGDRQREYIFFFIPYMFGTTYWGSRMCPERSVLIPCLHDEAYARLRGFQSMFAAVRGAIFLSFEERELALSLYDLAEAKTRVIGGPVDCGPSGDHSRLQRKYGLGEFLLYAGRTDKGKNADLLIEYFNRYIADTRSDLKLVFIGGGDVPASSERIVSHGFVTAEEKHDFYAAALAMCIPSTVESFSIVMMESWLAGRPVIVNGRCAVTSGFCRRSNGGLYFDNYDEFRGILDELRGRPGLAATLGQQGGAFVRANFEPAVVARRYQAALADWFEDDFAAAAG